MRVLLIEDDDGNALLAEDFLAEGSLDVRLLRARTLREALGECYEADRATDRLIRS